MVDDVLDRIDKLGCPYKIWLLRMLLSIGYGWRVLVRSLQFVLDLKQSLRDFDVVSKIRITKWRIFLFSALYWMPLIYHIYQPLRSGRIWHKVNFKRSLTGLNSEYSFLTSCFTKAEEISLSYYLPIARGRIIGFIPFPRVLVLCENAVSLVQDWTSFAVSISYDENHYTTDTSINATYLCSQITWKRNENVKFG